METKKNNENEQLQQQLEENELDQVTGGFNPNSGNTPGQTPPAPGTPGYSAWMQNYNNQHNYDNGNDRPTGDDSFDSHWP